MVRGALMVSQRVVGVRDGSLMALHDESADIRYCKVAGVSNDDSRK